MAEQRVYQGHVYTRNGPGESWTQQQAAPSAPDVVVPPNPYRPAQENRAERGEQRADVQLQIAQQNANKPPEGYTRNPDGSLSFIVGGPNDPAVIATRAAVQAQATAQAKPVLSATERAEAIAGYTSADAIDKMVADMERLYKAGPGATSGPAGIKDYFPTTANERFSAAGNAARGDIGTALKFTGGQLNTAAEAAAAVGPYLPQASDRDAVILDKIQRLKDVAARARKRSVAVLGGVPDANGVVTPIAPPTGPQATPLNGMVYQGGANVEAAPAGSTSGLKDLPPGYQEAVNAYIGSGKFTPEGYAQIRSALDRSMLGPNAQDRTAEYERFGRETIAPVLQRGGTIKDVPGVETQMSGREQLRNNLVNNPAGATLASAADFGGFGIPRGLAPDAYQALDEQHPYAMPAGAVLGAVAGTSLLGKLGRETIGRIAPQTLGGGAGAQFGRNLATDTLYSGIYGANTGQDPVMSALMGGTGSVLGQGVGTVLGHTISGINPGQAVTRLRAQGVTPTIGQIFRGRASEGIGGAPSRAIAGAEDVVANTGVANALVNDARRNTLEQANLAGSNTVSGGTPITAVGEEGLDQLAAASGQHYDNALHGVRIDPADPVYVADMAAANTRGRAVDAARQRGDFGHVVDTQVNPLLGTQSITSDELQNALRVTRGQSRLYNRAATGAAPDPMAAGVADALDDVSLALTDAAGRANPVTIPALKAADAVYRGLSVLDAATLKALNEGGVWTGAQLGQAITANTARFGNRTARNVAQSPLHQLQQDMVAVLPNKVPPTGVNAAPALALAGLGATVTGHETDQDWLKTAGITALLATPYTRLGQNVVARALLDRPQLMQVAGKAVSRRAGLAADTLIPFMIAPDATGDHRR